jgi:two-component system response regulator NreC
VSGHRPDILVLDLTMPGGSGLGALPEVKSISPDTRVVVLTMHGEPAFVREAMQSGASAYVLKDAADTELVKAVRLAAEDHIYLQPDLGARLASERETAIADLSDREVEVLKLIALGHTNAEIAEQLYLSVRTVESHRAHIQQKLGRTTRSELVRFALDQELIEI